MAPGIISVTTLRWNSTPRSAVTGRNTVTSSSVQTELVVCILTISIWRRFVIAWRIAAGRAASCSSHPQPARR